MPAPPAEGFESRPNRTLMWLSAPILVSLVAEPLVGLADTAFVARLGAAPAAALGVAVTLLSGMFWVFNFLGIATQSEIAAAHGAGDLDAAGSTKGQALALCLVFGVGLGVLIWPFADSAVRFMGATGEMASLSVSYVRVRLFAAPAVLLTLAAFGLLRGVQDMRTPLWVALAVNAVNVVVDPILIFGFWGFPAMGLTGAAWASTLSHWLGALVAVWAVQRRLPAPLRVDRRGMLRFLNVGWNLFLRTGTLMVFLLLSTRAATTLGAQAGAAHQGMRQIWLLSAFALDAYAGAAQSLVGYFRGAARWDVARKVASHSCAWALGTGVMFTAALWGGGPWIAALLVPESAHGAFFEAWIWVAVCQPVNALSFVTDGLHWGTMDFAFLRNAMIGASLVAAGILIQQKTLYGIWAAIALWIALRAGLGLARIWPGVGRSPWHEAPSD